MLYLNHSHTKFAMQLGTRDNIYILYLFSDLFSEWHVKILIDLLPPPHTNYNNNHTSTLYRQANKKYTSDEDNNVHWNIQK